MKTAEEIASYVYHCFRTVPKPPWLCGKEYFLVGTQMGVPSKHDTLNQCPFNVGPTS